MRTTMLIAGALALSLAGTGCVATHKYVAKSVASGVAPVETRVTGTEAKNTEQDTKLGAQGKEIEDLDRDLSRTKERLTDTDAKATAAGDAAKTAGQKAVAAGSAADGPSRPAASPCGARDTRSRWPTTRLATAASRTAAWKFVCSCRKPLRHPPHRPPPSSKSLGVRPLDPPTRRP